MNFKLLPILVLIGNSEVIPTVFTQRSFSSYPCLQSNRHGKIVGGANAIRGESPFIASLNKRGGHFCGASIISDKWLLTAAHCLCNSGRKFIRPTQIKGILGLYRISDYRNNNILLANDDERPYEVTFTDIIVHPEYKCDKPDNDIALLKLSQAITFNDYIQPICIHTEVDAKVSPKLDESFATVYGWGWTHENQEIGVRSDTLQKARVDIWSNSRCQDSFRLQNKPHIIRNTQMCAGRTEGGVDACWADSGGPLVSRDRSIVGIVSTGIGCARPGLPGIYTRLSQYIDWMDNIIAEN